MRHLSRYEAFAFNQAEDHHQPLLADVSSPAQQVSRVFNFQSYFDSTLLENALLRQPTNDPIVSPKEEQMPGYAVGLHPSSQTPIAIEFRVGSQKSSSGPLILKPGEFIRPYGLPGGQKQGAFSGFRWGLPFGWLGGGLATLKVFQTPDAYADWPEHAEVIFHRARFQIIAPGAVPDTFPKNWPLRFPWTQAQFGAVPISQSGDPSIALTPTRVLLQLRLETVASPGADYRIYWQGSEFGLDSAGAIVTTEASYIEDTFGERAALGITGPASEFEVEDGPVELVRLAADIGGVQFVSSVAAIQSAYVDVVRYGRL